MTGHLRVKYHKHIQQVMFYQIPPNIVIYCLNCNHVLYTEIKKAIIKIRETELHKRSTIALKRHFESAYGFKFEDFIIMGSTFKLTQEQINDKVMDVTNQDAIPFQNGINLAIFFKLPFNIVYIKSLTSDDISKEASTYDNSININDL